MGVTKMKKKLLFFNVLVACFIAGFYTCNYIFTLSYNPNAYVIHVGYSPSVFGCLDPYTTYFYQFHKELSSKKNRTDSVTWRNVYNKLEYPAFNILSDKTLDSKLLVYPRHDFCGFFNSVFLITNDTLFEVLFTPVSIVVDTLKERIIYKDGEPFLETRDFRPSSSPY